MVRIELLLVFLLFVHTLPSVASSHPREEVRAVDPVQTTGAQEIAENRSRVSKQSPKDPRQWTELVTTLFQNGSAEQAVITAQDALGAIPDNSQLAVTLATICLYYQQTQPARHFLEDALELEPGDADIHVLLARVSLLAGEPNEALAVLGNMPASAKERPDRLLLMGEALALTGNLDAAASKLGSALKVSPTDVPSLTTYAWVLQLQGRYREALPILVKAGELDPKLASIPYRLAVSYYFLRSYAKAEKSCEKALALDAHDAKAYFMLAMTRVRERNVARAENDLRKAVALGPDVALFHRELGKVLLQGPNLSEASKELDQSLTLDSADAENYFWRAQLSLKQGERQRAVSELNTAVALDPNYSAAYVELAHLYSQAGQRREAARVVARQRQIHAPIRNSGEDRQLLIPPH
jgi:tetratricopeptide (TPR) repeat protein